MFCQKEKKNDEKYFKFVNYCNFLGTVCFFRTYCLAVSLSVNYLAKNVTKTKETFSKVKM